MELSPFLFANFLKDVAQYCKCVKSKIFAVPFYTAGQPSSSSL